jgi:FtsZ-binding cell division protein ZapB
MTFYVKGVAWFIYGVILLPFELMELFLTVIECVIFSFTPKGRAAYQEAISQGPSKAEQLSFQKKKMQEVISKQDSSINHWRKIYWDEVDLRSEEKKDRIQLEIKIKAVKCERDALQGKYDALQGKYDALQGKYDALQGKHDALQDKHDALQDKHDALQGEYDTQRYNTDAQKKR